MSSASTASVNPKPHETSAVAAFLTFLVPGLGQIYQGRYAKGLLFMVCLLGMFTLGQAMGNWQNVYMPPGDDMPGQGGRGVRGTPASLITRWHYIGQFWIGVAAWPAIWQYFEMPMGATDKNSFWHNYQKAPDE